MGTNAQRLLDDVKTQLAQYNIPNAEKYEANVVAFLNQCPDDVLLENATVAWDNEEEFDFNWDTPHLDCCFSISLDDTRFHFWAGVNNHSENDECYQQGVGGLAVIYDDFARDFYDSLKWEIITCERK